MKRLYKRAENLNKLIKLVISALENDKIERNKFNFIENNSDRVEQIFNNIYDEQTYKEYLKNIIEKYNMLEDYPSEKFINDVCFAESEIYGALDVFQDYTQNFKLITNLSKEYISNFIKDNFDFDDNLISEILNSLYKEKHNSNLLEEIEINICFLFQRLFYHKCEKILPIIIKELQVDNWDYNNTIDNEFEKRPNKRINRILKRIYKDAKKWHN